jgi:hypothetical protein
MEDQERSERSEEGTSGQAPKPTVGRTVHFTEELEGDGGKYPVDRAAIITEVDTEEGGLSNIVTLMVFVPGQAPFTVNDVSFGEHGECNTWHWPERV